MKRFRNGAVMRRTYAVAANRDESVSHNYNLYDIEVIYA